MKKEIQTPGITVDIVVFTIVNDELSVLLINRENQPYKNMYALPGGYLHTGETTHEAAVRILAEKAGVTNVYMEQLYTFDTKGRDPRGPVFSVTYVALVSSPFTQVKDTSKIESPEITPISKIKKLAFDHNLIIDYAIKRIRAKIEYTTAAFSLLPSLFPISQLQSVYESILGRKLDKRNFRKKIENLGIIKATKKKTEGDRQRPAVLYSFVDKKVIETIKII